MRAVLTATNDKGEQLDPQQQFWVTEVGYNTGFDPDGPKNPIPAQTDAGQVAFNLWTANGMAAPVTMATIGSPALFNTDLRGDTDGNLQPDTQLFRIFAGVTMDGVTLTRGLARGTNATGGAVYVGPVGQLTLRNCAV